MAGQSPANTPHRAIKAGGPPALITAGIGVGATGIAGKQIESQTEPVANTLAQTVGLNLQLGPALLLLVAILVFALAIIMPGLFD